MKALLLAILILTGCASASPLCVDSQFTPEERDELTRAAAEWERATNGMAHIDLVFGAITHPGQAHTISRSMYNWTELDGNTIIDRQSITFYMVAITSVHGSLYETALHEFGHYLGLGHSPDTYAVMFHSYHPITCLTLSDLREYCTVEGCQPRELSPCDAGMLQ